MLAELSQHTALWNRNQAYIDALTVDNSIIQSKTLIIPRKSLTIYERKQSVEVVQRSALS
jgi:hypothetical protein